MKEGGSLQALDLEFSSASVYRGNTVTAVEVLSVLYEVFVRMIDIWLESCLVEDFVSHQYICLCEYDD